MLKSEMRTRQKRKKLFLPGLIVAEEGDTWIWLALITGMEPPDEFNLTRILSQWDNV